MRASEARAWLSIYYHLTERVCESISLSARSQVAELLQERAGVSIEKKHITAPDLKHVGRGTCTIQLHKDVTCKFELEIVAA